MENALTERRGERRADPVLATMIDVAIAYRVNLGWRVAQAFMHETGVPAALAMQVLCGTACLRSTVPRRRTPGTVQAPAPDAADQALRRSSTALEPKPSASK